MLPCSSACPNRAELAARKSALGGLVFSADRDQIAFTVPPFGRYLRAHD